MRNKRIPALLAALLLLFTPAAMAEEAPMKIVAVNFPCFDAARAVAGSVAEVRMLLPPGIESHSYEPTPRDIIEAKEADLFLYVGGESDTWVEGILDSFEEEAPRVLTLTECVVLLEEELTASMEEEHGEEEEEGPELDEHVWTSPVNMMKIAERLCQTLSDIAPDRAETFRANTDAFLAELDELDASFREITENAPRRFILFGDRFPLRYFAAEYGLEYDAAFPGCSYDSEPSVRTVVSLIDRIRADRVPAVFYIEYSSRRTADILAEETGAKELLFHSCHNVSAEDLAAGATYLSLMRQNAENLKEALTECR